jgi:hypothetical protein
MKDLAVEHYDNSYDKQVAESIRSLFELTSRVDERVKLMSDNYQRIDTKFDSIVRGQQELLQRVTALESRNGTEIKKVVEELSERVRKMEINMQSLEIVSKGNQNKWDKAIDYGMRILVAIAAALLTFKLGIAQ